MRDHDERNRADDHRESHENGFDTSTNPNDANRPDPITSPLKGGDVSGDADTADDRGGDRETPSSPAWLIPIGNILDEPLPPEAYLFGLILIQGVLTLLSGQPGGGKTTLAYFIAAQLARYGVALGFGSGEQIGVAYLDLESPRWLMRKKVAEACQGVPPENFLEVNENLLRQDLTVIVEALRRHRIKLLIIDTLNRALPIENVNDATESSNRMLLLSKIARASGAAVLVLAHPQKNANRAAVYNVAGSLEAAAVADIVVIAKTTKNRIMTLEVVKNRIAEAEDLTLLKCGAGVFEKTHTAPKVPTTKTGKAAKAIEDAVRESGPLAQLEAIKIGMDASGASKSTAERAIEDLIECGVIIRNTRGELILSMPSPPPHTDEDAPPPSTPGVRT